MEQDFGERLKKYRKEKNLTQQDLADRLGVSNKTVSRWESGGGYPDVPVLSSLARVLGVTVDDLLDEKRPVRTLTKTDGQNLLSFAFALGGGMLFFLLKLFMPVILCYLGYLGCMAYGVYLQRYYCYQSRWFRLGNLVMNFFVNLAFAPALLGGIGTLISTAVVGGANFPEGLSEGLLKVLAHGPRYLVWGGILLGALLTAATAWLVERKGFGNRARLALGLRRLTVRGAAPAVGALVLLGFWLFFWPNNGAAQSLHPYQLPVYCGLWLALVLLCGFLFLKKGRRWGLASTAVLALGGWALPAFAVTYVWLENSGRLVVDDGVIAAMYPRVFCATPALLAAGAVLAALCLIPALVRVTRKPEETV